MTPASLLHPDAFLSPLAIEDAVTRALDEDLGRAGDVTSIATIPAGTRGNAVMAARKAGTIAGLTVAAKAALMTIDGDARALLAAERAAINFVGHLSGIATAAAEFVRLVAHTK